MSKKETRRDGGPTRHQLITDLRKSAGENANLHHTICTLEEERDAALQTAKTAAVNNFELLERVCLQGQVIADFQAALSPDQTLLYEELRARQEQISVYEREIKCLVDALDDAYDEKERSERKNRALQTANERHKFVEDPKSELGKLLRAVLRHPFVRKITNGFFYRLSQIPDQSQVNARINLKPYKKP